MNSASGTGFIFTGGGAALVAGNDIVGVADSALCGTFGVGASVGSGARLENNTVLGLASAVSCTSSQTTYPVGTGLLAAGNGDVDSNEIVAMASCPSLVTQGFPSASALPTGLRIIESGGTFRNNILSPRPCGYAVGESSASADPLVFEHNALSPAAYRDEAMTVLSSAFAIDALTDMASSGNLESDCAPVSNGHLQLGSPCINAGTLAGAPWRDADGDVRDAVPDIGPDEYQP